MEYLIDQGDSLLLDQIERIRGEFSDRVNEMILIEAPRNPKKELELRRILNDGFSYNGTHYVRFGKSASQGKDGITAFVDKSIYQELLVASQLDIKVSDCVISRYEAQRCLIFSTCELIEDYMPYIVVIDEYTKTIENQYIRYVVQKKKEYTDKEGKTKTYNSREIEEGYHNIELSPFDGGGCHSRSVSEKAQEVLNLDYLPVGLQIRLPFFKGYSIEFDDFKVYLKDVLGVTTITDVFGIIHKVDDIDCLWNTSMFKGYSIFKDEYGSDGWNKYLEVVKKYNYKLGISKHSHHMKDIDLKSKMNFQYLQCLDLYNDKYVKQFKERDYKNYDILSHDNEGKMINIAKYTTELCEKIIKGDKFYTYKFLGINNTNDYEPEGRYLEAVLVNDIMLQDPAVKQYIYRKLKKTITEMKYGKIYVDGFYHTLVLDVVGYLEYAAGKKPVGCLKSNEFYCDTIPKGKTLSFRSPLVCPSEVNEIQIVENDITKRWFSHFKHQDVVMVNMHDISMPQQGGADIDGDAVFLCHDEVIVDSKINKPIIIDIDDKATAKIKPYTKENITDYEVNSRDNRIGEITNVATSVINSYTDDQKYIEQNEDNVSLLRIFQGKEIDYQKTGLRWQMNKQLRKYLKKLPFFLLYNYPNKMNAYYRVRRINKDIENQDDKLELNSYHSPSPMNELANYVDTWERRNIIWDKSVVDVRCIVLNSKLDLSNKKITRDIRRLINEFSVKWKHAIQENLKSETDDSYYNLDILINTYKIKLLQVVNNEELVANYVIKISYSNLLISKALAWRGYGEYIIENLKLNTPTIKHSRITEVPYSTDLTYEFLGKHYTFEDGEIDI